jgi:hypothetical protein
MLRPGCAARLNALRTGPTLTPLIEPRLPDSDHRTLQARTIAAAAITCLQAANQEWLRLGGRADLFDLYDTAVQAIRRPA